MSESPRQEKYERITVRLIKEDYDAVLHLAEEKGEDLAVYIRELIQSHLLLGNLDEKIDSRIEEAIVSGKHDDAIFKAYLRKLGQKQNSE